MYSGEDSFKARLVVRTADLLRFRQLCENAVGLKLYEFWREMFLLSRDILGIFESDQLGNAKETLVREEEVVVLEDLDIAEKVLFIETKKAAQVLKVKNEAIVVTFIFSI